MKTIRLSVIILFYGFMVAGCANPGMPTGGEKDETPPVIRRSSPKLNQLGFKGNELRIEFDEQIQLKEASTKLMVSPPLNSMPSVIERGNELIVTIKDTLQDNTTYTFDFADAVLDYNEGNVLENFRFSFSTGQVVDSLGISGHLFLAGALTPVENVLVFIHENLSDSAFYKRVPVRVSKTDNEGKFTLANVRPGKYRLFALDDVNRNYKYDPIGERIAWLDSFVIPSIGERTIIDSIAVDSVVSRVQKVLLPDSLQLFLFDESKPKQYLSDKKRSQAGSFSFIFDAPVENFNCKLLGDDNRANWSILESNSTKDSLTLWITDKTLQAKDSILTLVQYTVTDSLDMPILKSDSVLFTYFKPEERKRTRKEGPAPKASLNIANLGAKINHFNAFNFSISTLPSIVNWDGIKLFKVVDSVKVNQPFKISVDSLKHRRFTLKSKWEPEGKYELVIDSAAIVDLYGITNNEVKHKFDIRSLDDYGTTYVTVLNNKPNWLLQIVNDKNEVLRQSPIPSNGKVAFKLLMPSELKLRIVVDENANGQWDTGNFKEGIQPETVYFYPEKVVVRANWEHEVKWDPSTFNIYKHAQKFVKGSSTKTD